MDEIDLYFEPMYWIFQSPWRLVFFPFYAIWSVPIGIFIMIKHITGGYN